MFSLSCLLKQSRRGRTLSRALILVLLLVYCFKATLHTLEFPNAGRYAQHISSLQKRLDGSHATTEKYPSQWPVGLHDRVTTIEHEAHENFTKNLENLLSLLPDQSHAHALAGPIKGTGEEKLREVGFRARAFKALLQAWEAIHLVPTSTNQMLIRDDIVQMLRDNPAIAADLHLDAASTIHTYETMRSFLTRFATRLFPWITPYFADHMTLHAQFRHAGRGLVFTAGNDQAPYLATSIRALRAQGCTLPIEVLYLGDEDLDEDAREALEALPGSVVTRDLSAMVADEGWKLSGWAAKPFAILLSSFREAIFIDADALFLRDPAVLFDDPLYRSTGALFFKDRLFMPGTEKRAWLRRILPAPVSRHARQSRMWTGESLHMQESGVVVVDKWRHFVALLMVTRMNGPDRDGNEAEGRVGVYDMVYGDKETFWLGWELVGDTDYAFHGGAAAVMGKAQVNRGTVVGNETAEEGRYPHFTICAPQLLHLGIDGRPLWFNGWLLPNKFSDDEHQQPTGFEAFIPEPGTTEDGGAWKLHENNVCCLSADRVVDFSAAE
ncbi:putative alpha-1,3-mannosyltransferase, partial [Aspergillus homomorphus CBS 101889]